MADFCKQCSIDMFGEDFKDLQGLSTSSDTANGLYATALCEGCGATQVDHLGICVSPHCDKKHGEKIMDNQQLKWRIMDKLSSFPNSTIIKEVVELVKQIDSQQQICQSCMSSVGYELAKKCPASKIMGE